MNLVPNKLKPNSQITSMSIPSTVYSTKPIEQKWFSREGSLSYPFRAPIVSRIFITSLKLPGETNRSKSWKLSTIPSQNNAKEQAKAYFTPASSKRFAIFCRTFFISIIKDKLTLFHKKLVAGYRANMFFAVDVH